MLRIERASAHRRSLQVLARQGLSRIRARPERRGSGRHNQCHEQKEISLDFHANPPGIRRISRDSPIELRRMIAIFGACEK
jgi:hypothetical protein